VQWPVSGLDEVETVREGIEKLPSSASHLLPAYLMIYYYYPRTVSQNSLGALMWVVAARSSRRGFLRSQNFIANFAGSGLTTHVPSALAIFFSFLISRWMMYYRDGWKEMQQQWIQGRDHNWAWKRPSDKVQRLRPLGSVQMLHPIHDEFIITTMSIRMLNIKILLSLGMS
jgi:hypothetical protein